MIDFSKFAMTPDAMRDFFEKNDFTRYFSDMSVPGVDSEALMAAQKKNMEALVEANVAAAEGFQQLFRRQVKMLEETMNEAKAQISQMEPGSLKAPDPEAQAEVMRAAFQRALDHMRELAETASKTNAEAYRIVSGRLEDSMKELRDMVEKKTG
ncbi:MAG: phasin family protein [Pseudomonadota bacterium]